MVSLTESGTIIADFFEDMAGMARQELLAAHYKVSSSDKAEEVVTAYFNVLARRIAARPRTVFIANGFQCPAEHRAGFDLVCEKAKSGDALWPHQSRKLADANFDDSLLNDWGINHLHLGTRIEADGFVTRSGPVLYARVTLGELSCIAIIDHGNWSKRQLLEIVHSNWPNSIAGSTIRGDGLEYEASDDQIKDLRAAGVNVLTQRADGTIHFGPGGGYATNGRGMQVVNSMIGWRRLSNKLERTTAEKLGDLLQEAARKAVPMKPPFEFHLQIDQGRTRAVETKSLVSVDFGSLLNIAKLN